MGTRSREQNKALLTDFDTDTAYSGAFHTIYANIRLNWDSEHSEQSHLSQLSQLSHCHTLMFTTPSSHIEQATLAANLAIVAAQSGTPTVLVDANLRTPTLQQRFGVGKNEGLSDLLEAETVTPQKVAASLCTTFIPGLRLLGAGNSTEKGGLLLLSPKLEQVICSIRQYVTETETNTSVVIFNSSPVLIGADASLIGALVEQTFLAIIMGRTTRAQAKQAQEQLQQVHAKLAGIIMVRG